jgi:hypothetical protein
MSKRIRKTGLLQPATSNNIQPNVPLPSKISCDTCFNNMNNENFNCAVINETLSSKEKIVNFDKLLYKYDRIQVDAITNEIIKLKRLRQIEVEKIEQAEATRAKKSKNDHASEDEQKKVAEMATFSGKKRVFVEKTAHYYFNINNPLGLHLSEVHIHHIANMLCANFKAANGTFLNLRQTLAGLKMGLSMDPKGEIVLK